MNKRIISGGLQDNGMVGFRQSFKLKNNHFPRELLELFDNMNSGHSQVLYLSHFIRLQIAYELKLRCIKMKF